jgi:hypothetical protein
VFLMAMAKGEQLGMGLVNELVNGWEPQKAKQKVLEWGCELEHEKEAWKVEQLELQWEEP